MPEHVEKVCTACGCIEDPPWQRTIDMIRRCAERQDDTRIHYSGLHSSNEPTPSMYSVAFHAPSDTGVEGVVPLPPHNPYEGS